jgi:hypothetical protein
MNLEKPVAKISGEDGNIFAVMGRAGAALRRAARENPKLSGDYKRAKSEMVSRVMSAGSYDEALGIVLEYVEDWDGENDPEEYPEE